MSSRQSYKTTEVGEIPEEWRVNVLSNVIKVNPSRPLVSGREYPFIPMDALTTDSRRVSYTLRRVWSRSSGSRFQNGDVLLARITPSAENGKTALVDFLTDDGRGFGSTEFLVLGVESGGIEDSEFLYYLIKFDKIRNQAIQRMTGSTGRQRIPPEAFNDIQCPVPPFSEQRKIASILSTVDDAIQKNDEIIAKTQQLKKGLMQQLLTKGTGHGPLKQTEMGEVPEDWEVVSYYDITERITYGFTNPMPHVAEGPYIVTAKNIKDGIIDYKSANRTSDEAFLELLTDKSRPRKGDVLLTKDGTIGRSAVVDRSDICINQSVALLRPKNERILSEFLHLSLQSPPTQRKIDEGSIKTTLRHIAITKLGRMKFALPPTVEQRRIVEICDLAHLKSANEIKKMARLLQLKNGLMQVLLTGKVRVKVS